MEAIVNFITAYGLPVFILASIIIALIGIIKLTGLIKKIENKDLRKVIYYILNISFAFAVTAAYFGIFKIAFNNYLSFSFTVIGATTTLYALYENFGVRKLVQMSLAGIASWFKSNPENKVVKNLKKMGLTEESVLELTKTINNTLEADKAKAVEEAKAKETKTTEVKPEITNN